VDITAAATFKLSISVRSDHRTFQFHPWLTALLVWIKVQVVTRYCLYSALVLITTKTLTDNSRQECWLSCLCCKHVTFWKKPDNCYKHIEQDTVDDEWYFLSRLFAVVFFSASIFHHVNTVTFIYNFALFSVSTVWQAALRGKYYDVELSPADVIATNVGLLLCLLYTIKC
jgi:hypothetical protein